MASATNRACDSASDAAPTSRSFSGPRYAELSPCHVAADDSNCRWNAAPFTFREPAAVLIADGDSHVVSCAPASM
ncbi:hypothetical protein [Zhihengliuella salsuginis]|uniref:hypothetical protein n=1 Tax=Zhihengliuella salsuginis TaxID=578222 RepID=UPI00167364B7|nr:hypothetical protein [Zhihengliuella salsuginis]